MPWRYKKQSNSKYVNNLSNIDKHSDLAADCRTQLIAWEKEHGFANSLEGDTFKTYPMPDQIPTEDECRTVLLNDGLWPKRLPDDEKDSVETFAEAFTRAISKETTLSPEKLSLSLYKQKLQERNDPEEDTLTGTPWEYVWKKA